MARRWACGSSTIGCKSARIFLSICGLRKSIFHIAPRGVNCAILSIYITGYAYGKEPEGFQKVFLGLFRAG